MAKKLVKTLGLPLSLIFALLLAGCSGGVSTAANNTNNSPATAPTVTLTVTPATISAGQSAILSWASVNATSVVIDQGIGTEPANGSINVSPNATVTYHATAQGADGKATAAATVTVSGNPSGPAPLVQHVFIVMEENHGYADVIGNASMPYLNQLAAGGGLATHYFANTHPSIGNYFELTTGQIISNDDTFSQTVTADNIVRELLTAGKTWKSYAENLPSPGYLGGDVYPYLRHHNPFTYFSDVANSSVERANIVPFTQLSQDVAKNTMPMFSFIIPSALDDAHDGSLQQADNWLKTNIAPLIANPVFQREGLLIILFDESEVTDIAFGGGHVAMVMVGPHVKAGFQSTNFYQHQSTLRMMLESLGAKQFPGDSASAPEMGEFFK